MMKDQNTGCEPVRDGSMGAMFTTMTEAERKSAHTNQLHVTAQALASSFGPLAPTEAVGNKAAFDALHRSGQVAAISAIVTVASKLWRDKCRLNFPDYLCLRVTSRGDSAGCLVPFDRACIALTDDPLATLEQMHGAAPADTPALQFWHVNGNADLFAVVVALDRSGALQAWVVDDDAWIPVPHPRRTFSSLLREDCAGRPTGTALSALRVGRHAPTGAAAEWRQEVGNLFSAGQRDLFEVLFELARSAADSNGASPRLCG
jgi:hypothetical protein